MYPQSIDKFTEKLNKVDGNTYVIEEEVNLKDGVYEGELEHDNVSNSSVRVYTGPKLTGEKLENFILSTPSTTPWKTIIRLYGNVDKAYITYETPGDTIEAEDINKVQESIVNTQKALNSEVERATKSEENLNNDLNSYKATNDGEIQGLKTKDTDLENKKANKTYVDTELNKRYLKDQVFTKEEVLQNIKDVIGTAPEALDTLQEIAEALNNDADFAGTMTNELSKKVDKVVGKQLSTEDYTTAEKNKLAGIEQGANKYIHPSGTNPHGTTKSDVGLSNVDNTKQATKTEFDAHIADSVRHITAAERTAWNAKSDKAYVDTELAKKQNKLSYTPVNKAGDTMTGQLVIDGAAADRPLVVRGISGSGATGETPDTLYLNFDSNNSVIIGSSRIILDPTNNKITVGSGTVWHSGIFNPSTKADVGHTHDDRYYTETEANSKFATKEELGNAGNGDMLKSVYDKNNNGKVDAAEVADSVPWTGVTGKPSTFNPSTHTHTIANVTGLQSALDGKMNKGSITWNQLKGV